MKFVQPIRNQRKLEEIKQYLKDSNERDYILFMIGINTGLRISDILPLQVHHVEGAYINLREQKTYKHKSIKINPTLRKELDKFTDGKPGDEYLFKSRSRKTISGLKGEPIDTSMAYRMLSRAARKFGLKEIGTHSMRKTFGYHFYLRTKNIALLMDLFNHSDQSITLRYIGINQDEQDNILSSFSL